MVPLALALISTGELIFLDEPTTGLEPEGGEIFWDLVKMSRNKTIVLTTHYMEEAYALCDENRNYGQGADSLAGHAAQLLFEHFGDVALRPGWMRAAGLFELGLSGTGRRYAGNQNQPSAPHAAAADRTWRQS